LEERDRGEEAYTTIRCMAPRLSKKEESPHVDFYKK